MAHLWSKTWILLAVVFACHLLPTTAWSTSCAVGVSRLPVVRRRPSSLRHFALSSPPAAAALQLAMSANSERPSRLRRWSQRLRSAALTVFAVAAVAARTPVANAKAPAQTSPQSVEVTVSFSGRQRLRGSEQMSSLALSAAVVGGLSFWAVRTGKRLDVEEEERITGEVKRLDKIKDEWQDVDGEGGTDNDLLASFKARLGNLTLSGKDDEGGSGGEPDEGGGGLASPPKPDDGDSGGGSTEDIERLKRMMGGGDADKK